MTLLQVVGEPKREEAAHNRATEFSGYVQRVPQVRSNEKMVLSQVLVPPLAEEYSTVKKAWMEQKLWKDKDHVFIEIMNDDCTDEQKAAFIAAIEQYLELHMNPIIKGLKHCQDHNWKRLLVESFETSMRDPAVSDNVETYTVSDSDPIADLRGQLGLKTVHDSDIFVVGVYRSRTMSELPTYTEQERVNSPVGFQKSPYWWGLELDRYAVDGILFQPSWMAEGPVCERPPSKSKRKHGAAKGSVESEGMVKEQPPMWSVGYTMVHSAFGYGNETVLCNDPHAMPYTSLDDAEAVEDAVKKSNISVKICRIGPWVFPIELTTRFLPKGSPLLYFYGRGYWITNRASLALATLADEREGKLKRENEALQSRLQHIQQQHHQAVELLSSQADARLSWKHGHHSKLPHQGSGSTPELRTHQQSTKSLALTVPHDSAKSDIGTSQPNTRGRNGDWTAAVGQLDNALSISSGAAAGAVGNAFRPPGAALASVHAEVHDLRHSLGTMLQRLGALESTLHDMGQQQLDAGQIQMHKSNDDIHPYFQLGISHPQHAQQAVNSETATDMQAPQIGGPAARHSSSSDAQPRGGNQHGTEHRPDDSGAQQKLRKRLKVKLKVSTAGGHDAQPADAPQGAEHSPGHGMTAQQQQQQLAGGTEAAAGTTDQAVQGDDLASKKRKGRASSPAQIAGQLEPEAAQTQTAAVVSKKKKRKKTSDAAPSAVPDLAAASKKKKKKRDRKETAEGAPLTQNAAEWGGDTEGARNQDQDAELQRDVQWGTKQRRKHRRVPAAHPSADSLDQSRNEATVVAAASAAAGLVSNSQRRLHGQAIEPQIKYTVPAEEVGRQSRTATIDWDLRGLAYSAGERERISNLLQMLTPGTVVSLAPPQARQRLLTSFYTPPAVASAEGDDADLAVSSGADQHSGGLDPHADVAQRSSNGDLPNCAEAHEPGPDVTAAAAAGTAGASSAGATAATADGNHLDPGADGPTAGVASPGGGSGSGGELAEPRTLLPHVSISKQPDRALAGGGGGAEYGDEAEEGSIIEESEQVGATEGTVSDVDVRPLLNTTKCRFVLVEDVKVDVGPEGQDPLRVRRRTVAAQDAHVPCYLIAKDILKACGIPNHNPGRTIKTWISRANRVGSAALPRRAYWSMASNSTFVFGAEDVQALMLPGVLSEEQRHALQRFTANMWITCEVEAAQPVGGGPAATPEAVWRADSSSPAPKAELASPDPVTVASPVVGPALRAAGNSPAPRAELASPVAVTVASPVAGPALRAAGNSPTPRAELASPVPVTVASPVVGPALRAAGNSPAPRAELASPVAGPALRAAGNSPEPNKGQCQALFSSIEAVPGRAGANSPNDLLHSRPNSEVIGASRVADISKAAVAEAEAEVEAAAEAALDAAGCSDTVQARQSNLAAGSGGNCPVQDHCDLPMKDEHSSPGTQEGRALAAQSPGHMSQEGPTVAPVTPAPQAAPQAAPAKVATSMYDGSIGGMLCNGESATIGKRKQARKSTRNASQPAASVQQSNAAEAEVNEDAVDVKPIILDSSAGSAAAQPTPYEVIDLT